MDLVFLTFFYTVYCAKYVLNISSRLLPLPLLPNYVYYLFLIFLLLFLLFLSGASLPPFKGFGHWWGRKWPAPARLASFTLKLVYFFLFNETKPCFYLHSSPPLLSAPPSTFSIEKAKEGTGW
jgi:hypothetical protein